MRLAIFIILLTTIIKLGFSELYFQNITLATTNDTYTYHKYRDISTCTCDTTAYVCNYFCCCD